MIVEGIATGNNTCHYCRKNIKNKDKVVLNVYADNLMYCSLDCFNLEEIEIVNMINAIK